VGWIDWPRRWNAALEACTKLGGEAKELIISEPATENEIQAVEAELGIRLPEGFRSVLLNFAAKVSFSWFLPDTPEPPSEMEGIFCGDCTWDLAKFGEIDKERQGWIREVFPDADNLYHAVWHNKLAFHQVGNGDYLAIDLNLSATSPVVYLSHDDGKGHGYHLGRNFVDFIECWSMLGCPGAEDWQWLPFTSSSTSGIDPRCKNAQIWRDWFGLEL
jgi:hypothetical protein